MRNLTAAIVMFMFGIVNAAALPGAADADNVLMIPKANAGGSGGLVLLAEVSARMREAELNQLTCSANPEAELEYEGALQALSAGRFESGIVHLEAADKVLSVTPYGPDFR